MKLSGYVEGINGGKLRKAILSSYPTLAECAKELGKSPSFFNATFASGRMEGCAYRVLCQILDIDEDYLTSEKYDIRYDQENFFSEVQRMMYENKEMLYYISSFCKKLSEELEINIYDETLDDKEFHEFLGEKSLHFNIWKGEE